jgi:hypothetical protein
VRKNKLLTELQATTTTTTQAEEQQQPSQLLMIEMQRQPGDIIWIAGVIRLVLYQCTSCQIIALDIL